MKKYFIIAAILFLAAACSSSQPVAVTPTPVPAPIPPADPTASWQTYRYGPNSFEFKYPADFQFTQPTFGNLKNLIVQLEPTTNNYPGTNYVGSGFTVSNDYFTDPAKCYINPDTGKPMTDKQELNGMTFYKGKSTGVGAGNIYDATIYRALNQNWCTEITLTIHTANIGNFDPGTVTEVDPNKPLAVLQQMFETFKFVK